MAQAAQQGMQLANEESMLSICGAEDSSCSFTSMPKAAQEAT